MQGHCRYGKKALVALIHILQCASSSLRVVIKDVPRMTPVSMHILKFVKCYYYHTTGTVRPNLNQDLPRNTVPKRPVSDPTPLMHIRLPPLSPPHSPATDTQKSIPSFTKPYNVASSKTPDITSVFFRSNEVPDTTNPKHYESSIAPLPAQKVNSFQAQMF